MTIIFFIHPISGLLFFICILLIKNIYLKIIFIILYPILFYSIIYKYRRIKAKNMCWWCGKDNKPNRLKVFVYRYKGFNTEMRICSENCKQSLMRSWDYAKKTHNLALYTIFIVFIFPFIFVYIYNFLIKYQSNSISIWISIFISLLGLYNILFPMNILPNRICAESFIGLKYFIFISKNFGTFLIIIGVILFIFVLVFRPNFNLDYYIFNRIIVIYQNLIILFTKLTS